MSIIAYGIRESIIQGVKSQTNLAEVGEMSNLIRVTCVSCQNRIYVDNGRILSLLRKTSNLSPKAGINAAIDYILNEIVEEHSCGFINDDDVDYSVPTYKKSPATYSNGILAARVTESRVTHEPPKPKYKRIFSLS